MKRAYLQELETLVEGLYEIPVATVLQSPICERDSPFSEEQILVAGAIPKRRSEFAAARDCARRALRKLGGPYGIIGSGPGRAPIWPMGFVGSISHADDVCGAVVARAHAASGIGFDVEMLGDLPHDMGAMVCSNNEQEQLSTLPLLRTTNWEKISFSAKEAVYKAYYPATGRFLSFHDVALTFFQSTHVSGRFVASISVSEALSVHAVGSWALADHIFTGCVFDEELSVRAPIQPCRTLSD